MMINPIFKNQKTVWYIDEYIEFALNANHWCYWRTKSESLCLTEKVIFSQLIAVFDRVSKRLKIDRNYALDKNWLLIY